ncbi:polyphosphate kinase 2 [Microbulbifer flavimaris]|uniref:ADP/GDP-polyphosphate phosphotransferase n=1 Tax=Microbulbifer flavimaris TaxID=1781068 RepID=A0ABX4HZY2_9GAMM|nr:MULTISPECIES: polyphosphate kinase 2 [Microbulbifer]KUJ83562.1 polyphosphate kinase [Microbulbifer sp. ZGT114]PCO05720.1 polyphosphate kinase 2 [Microbulbifer flavimaris]
MAKRKGGGGNYKEELRHLQIELVKLQRHLIACDLQILILFEGRDAAGKDGTIKRIVEHLSPRETRVVALGKPSDRDRNSWYFQRYVPHLPSKQEMVLFNRSWYNRAGVERVMGFCSDHEYREFMASVVPFERMLASSGIQIIKYYLDIDREEQKARIEARHTDPLKQWKISPIDETAVSHWDEYSIARNEMFAKSHSELVPWYVVRANDKKTARLNVIRHLLATVECPEHDRREDLPDSDIVFPYDGRHLLSGKIAP